MGKSRAEIQREYRERKKKKEGILFLQKERDRVRKYYIPSKELTKSERKKRNEKKLKSTRKLRERKKEIAKQQVVLKFDFPNRSKGGKTRTRNTISQQTNKIRSLRRRLNNFQNKYYSLMRKLQRDMDKSTSNTPDTPRQRSMHELEEAESILSKQLN